MTSPTLPKNLSPLKKRLKAYLGPFVLQQVWEEGCYNRLENNPPMIRGQVEYPETSAPPAQVPSPRTDVFSICEVAPGGEHGATDWHKCVGRDK